MSTPSISPEELEFRRVQSEEGQAAAYRNVYLKSAWWRRRSSEIRIRDKHQCTVCSSKKNLNVHHKTYVRLWRERDDDLTTVCQGCHEKIHDIAPTEKPVVVEQPKVAKVKKVKRQNIPKRWRNLPPEEQQKRMNQSQEQKRKNVWKKKNRKKQEKKQKLQRPEWTKTTKANIQKWERVAREHQSTGVSVKRRRPKEINDNERESMK